MSPSQGTSIPVTPPPARAGHHQAAGLTSGGQHCTGERASVSQGLTEKDEVKITLSLKETEAPNSRRIRYHFPVPSISSPSFSLSPAAPLCAPSAQCEDHQSSTGARHGLGGPGPEQQVLPTQSTRLLLLGPHLTSQPANCNIWIPAHLQRGKLCDPMGRSRPRTNQHGQSKGAILQSSTGQGCTTRANTSLGPEPTE